MMNRSLQKVVETEDAEEETNAMIVGAQILEGHNTIGDAQSLLENRTVNRDTRTCQKNPTVNGGIWNLPENHTVNRDIRTFQKSRMVSRGKKIYPANPAMNFHRMTIKAIPRAGRRRKRGDSSLLRNNRLFNRFLLHKKPTGASWFLKLKKAVVLKRS